MRIQCQRPDATVFESALFRTTSAVVELPGCILISDPNLLPGEIETIRRHVETIREGRPLYLLFTHSDWDHIAGYRAFEGATTIASRAFADNPDPGKALDDIRKFDDEYYISRPYPLEYPSVDIVVEADGQTLALDGARLVFFLAPGHTPDGIFTLIEPHGIWLAGDYLSNVEFPFVYQGFKEYLHTLAKARHIAKQNAITMLVPGHGDVAMSSAEALSRIDESEEYLLKAIRAAQNHEAFDEEALLSRYPFPGLLRKFHRENLELGGKEFS